MTWTADLSRFQLKRKSLIDVRLPFTHFQPPPPPPQTYTSLFLIIRSSSPCLRFHISALSLFLSFFLFLLSEFSFNFFLFCSGVGFFVKGKLFFFSFFKKKRKERKKEREKN
uniref:Transmembrane protein n=1 Tax=Trypanosoma vivax (strain Y486) TaxID=1055687 RepID=G0TW60_TRYVY|nr:hypothetical protein TVY486_0503770 [Trypanosoma vivax Y486]